MPQSLSQIYLHITFSTKDRKPMLRDRQLCEKAHAYLAGVCKGQDCVSLIVGGMDDHVHLLCRMSKNLPVAHLVRELKRDSSKWLKKQTARLDGFHWQSGYGAFSVSPSHVDVLKTYIANQEIHHHRESFQDEFRRLCRKYGVAIDERYVWD